MVMRRDRIISKILTGAGHPATPDEVRAAYFHAEPTWLTTLGGAKSTPQQSEESYRRLDAMVFEHLFPEVSKAEVDGVSSLMRRMWPEVQRTVPLELYPDAEPTLRRLKEDGYKLALVSNASPDVAGTISALGLERFFPSIVVSGLVGVSKPNPEIFQIALRESGTNAAETVHVGDLYEADVKGANGAGITGILIDRDANYGALDCPKIGDLGEVYRFLE